MSERVLVTGATGKVGREVVLRLLESGSDVRAATRSPEKADRLLPPGTDVVEFDFDLAATWDEAVEWAERIFVVPPPFDPHAYRTLASFTDWAVQAGADHVVVLTAMGVEDDEELALRRVERLVEGTGVPHTFLRPNVYMQNFHPGFVGRQIREDGRFVLPAGQARVSVVDARDVGAVAARLLTDPVAPHASTAYTLTGPEALDHHRMAETLTRVSGREVTYEPCSDEEMAERLRRLGWPDDRIGMVLAFMRSIRDGVRARVTGDIERVLGRKPTAFEAWARERPEAWAAAG